MSVSIKRQAQTTEEYIEELKEALTKNPDCGTSHYNLAVALIKQERWEEAIHEFQEAIQSSPSLAEAYVDLGGIYFQQGDLER
ncbi:MAG: tetratricopeptide repeat protein, partial [Pseudomonadota bacterium]